jgi:hypothetical protein
VKTVTREVLLPLLPARVDGAPFRLEIGRCLFCGRVTDSQLVTRGFWNGLRACRPCDADMDGFVVAEERVTMRMAVDTETLRSQLRAGWILS